MSFISARELDENDVLILNDRSYVVLETPGLDDNDDIHVWARQIGSGLNSTMSFPADQELEIDEYAEEVYDAE
jgi:translation elongation factor P/translation initiation factor 5A